MSEPGINKVLAFEMSRRYEVCDRCGRMVRPMKVFFDGREFLCPECRTKHEVQGASAGLKQFPAEQSGNCSEGITAHS